MRKRAEQQDSSKMMECSDRLSWKAQMREFPQRETPMGDDDMDDHSQGGGFLHGKCRPETFPRRLRKKE